jgi:hypothetical protein
MSVPSARALRLAVAAIALGAVPAGPVAAAPGASSVRDGREYLVPELADSPFAVEPGPRPYRHRLSFSPGWGTLGEERLFSARLAYHPTSWFGTEVALGHNPDDSVHALLHTVNGTVRRPFPGRFQPYVTLGYGMILVYPGESLNADPVTKNVLAAGGGLEAYLREDVALRFELRDVRAIGRDAITGESAAYRYGESTIALSFYRTLDD